MNSKKIDYQILIITLMLSSFGILMVFSSSYYYALDNFGDKLHFVKQDLKWSLAGIVVILVASQFPYKIYKKLAVILSFIAGGSLALLLILDKATNGSRRWIDVGGNSFSPSELTKFAVIVFMAWVLSHEKFDIRKLKHLIGIVAYFAFICLLIVLQPDLSTAVLIALTSLTMIFASGLKWRYIPILGLSGIAAIYYKISDTAFRSARIESMFAVLSKKDDQIRQGLYALGSGGIFGKGIGESVQNKLYIPEPQNDFILATVGEELGFIGMLILLLFFLILVYRCLKVAVNAPDVFSTLLCVGIASIITYQVCMNYFVVTSMIPVTGITLPFISYGGNSKVIMFGLVGIVLNISKYSDLS